MYSVTPPLGDTFTGPSPSGPLAKSGSADATKNSAHDSISAACCGVIDGKKDAMSPRGRLRARGTRWIGRLPPRPKAASIAHAHARAARIFVGHAVANGACPETRLNGNLLPLLTIFIAIARGARHDNEGEARQRRRAPTSERTRTPEAPALADRRLVFVRVLAQSSR